MALHIIRPFILQDGDLKATGGYSITESTVELVRATKFSGLSLHQLLFP